MRDKYLYFGVVAAGTESFDDVDDATPVLQLTTGFVNPIPVGTDYLTNGGAKVTAPAIAAHVFGTGYNTPTVGDVVDITKGCTIHATSALITISTTAQDAVWGMDLSSTDADNDTFLVTQLKPYEALDAFVYNSRYLRGIAGTTATTTQLHFQGKTGDVGATHDVDTFTVTHGSAKFKEFAGQLTDVLADDNKVNGMVVVVDDMRGLVLPHDAAAIASVTQSATAS
tara:strand:+ start:784 stop:1461 length:678 start_codon:yes stop_codon:yes gene_type:complete